MKRNCSTGAVSVALSEQHPSDVEWAALLASTLPEHRFLSRHWYSAWSAAFLPMARWRNPLRWLVARHAVHGLAGVIPVADQKIGMLSTLSLAGYYWPFRAPPVAITLVDEVAAAFADWACVNTPSTPWRLGPTPRNTPAVEALIDAFAAIGWRIMEKRIGETYAVAINDSFSSFQQRLGGLIKKMAYYERRLRRSGSVEIRTPTQNDDHVLRDLAAIEERSWVSDRESGKPKFLGNRNAAFWSNLMAVPSATELRPMLLCVDGRPISYSLNLDAGSTRYIIANGYDEAFSTHSPGMVLAHHVLRDAVQMGRFNVEWGQGDSGYKSRWGANENLHLVDVLMLPPSLAGYAAMQFAKRTAHYTRVA
jgi:hypothetical protein